VRIRERFALQLRLYIGYRNFRPGYYRVRRIKGVTDDCAWTDPGARTNDASHLASYLENLVSPGSGVTFALQGDVDGHDDFFRTAVTVSGGYASQRGQLFGRAASDGRLDWVSHFDGDPPAL